MFDLSSIAHVFIGEALAAIGKALGMSFAEAGILSNLFGIAKELSDPIFSGHDLIWQNVGFVKEWL